MSARPALVAGWCVAIAAAVGVRAWNALAGPLMWGYDAWGHVAYVLFLDLYRSVPWADQGWSYFHPPLHYALGWVLAQFGSGEVLIRGLSLLGSAASLGTAALAAWLVRLVVPERPGLALVGFCAVAFLPVHFFMSPMPGNELTETLLTASAVSVFVANERRRKPGLAGSAAVGLLVGLALLTKFSGLLPLLVALSFLALRPWLLPGEPHAARRCAARGLLITAVALVLCAPYYARNVAAFGNPFELSRGYPLVQSVERDQPPGLRTWSHYFNLPVKLFADPNPLAPHLLRSVWGSVYLNVWADTYRESDVERALEAERGRRRAIGAMAVLGLLPTALFAAGLVLGLCDVWRGRRRESYTPLLLLAAASAAAFAAFTWTVPLWSALKSSYLLALSIPFGVFLARGVEALGRGPARAVGAALAAVALASAATATAGVVYPRRADAPATGAVRFYFGEYPEARSVYGRLVTGSGYPVAWLENLAAVELADGRPERARRLLARAAGIARTAGRADPRRQGRLAVATALAGDSAAALALLDAALAEADLPEVRANRGAIRAAAGDLAGAESDLRAALAATGAMTPPWLVLAELLERTERPAEAGAARARAAAAACAGPRGYPYGLGTGEVIEWGIGRRALLLWDSGGLRLAGPGFYREACRRLRDATEAG